MRVISQDGMIDFPYEHVIVNISYIDNKCIVANGVNCHDGEPFTVAKYDTEKKAMKAMEMLRDLYNRLETRKMFKSGFCDYCHIFQFPKNDEIQ